MKESNEFSLSTKTKYELIRYITKLEKKINKAIKLLEIMQDDEADMAIQALKDEK